MNGLNKKQLKRYNQLKNKFFGNDKFIVITPEIEADPDYKEFDNLARTRMLTLQLDYFTKQMTSELAMSNLKKYNEIQAEINTTQRELSRTTDFYKNPQ